MVARLFCDGLLRGPRAMSAPKRNSQGDKRLIQTYKPGDKVRILLGTYSGQVMTVRESTSDEVWLLEMPKRNSMSKGNIEKVEP
jgi:hypothetical protein